MSCFNYFQNWKYIMTQTVIYSLVPGILPEGKGSVSTVDLLFCKKSK
jgi:hypothetical protein